MVLRFFLLASVFFFVFCSVPERDNPYDPDGVNYTGEAPIKKSSNSSAKVSSSSTALPVPCPDAVTNSNSVSCDGQTYKTVVIGKQVWMAENFNYNVSNNKCGNPDILVNTTCDNYGRVYDWATAMALPSSCNYTSCGSQINTKHQGICPDGWRIPSYEDWEDLIKYVDPVCDASKNPIGNTCVAGTKLKATSGWTGIFSIAGTDDYGFSALPANVTGFGAGDGATWWNTSGADFVLYDNYKSPSINKGTSKGDGESLSSIRCVKDAPSSSSIVVNYHDETYETVVIHEQTWFKRNLNYAVEGSKCFGEDGKVYVGEDNNYNSIYKTLSTYEIQANCATYGRLYTWQAAMALSACSGETCSSQINNPHQGICPDGWHIPSDEDWNILIRSISPSCSDNQYCREAGTVLKSASLWNSYTGIPKGTDHFGFSALPGGYIDGYGYFNNVGDEGRWWSVSENNSGIFRSMYYGNDGVNYSYGDMGNSIRCVKD